MTEELIDYYHRLLGEYPGGLQQAMCVTYAQGIDEDGFIRAFGGDPAEAEPRTFEGLGRELARYSYDKVPYTVLVTRVGDWIVGIEDNGFQGSRSEVMRGASAGGAALSVYWNVNGSNRFTYNVAGRRQVGFNMDRPEDRWGDDIGVLDPLLADLPFGHEEELRRWPLGLAAAELVTGVRLTRELLAGTFRRAVLTELPGDLIPEGKENEPALAHPFIQAMVAAPAVEHLPKIAAFQAHLVADDAGIQDEPAVRQALSVLDARAAGADEPAGDLLERLDALVERYRAGFRTGGDRHAFRRMHAVQGVRGALGNDPRRAAFDVYWSGGYSLREPDARLQSMVLNLCVDRAAREARGS